ncbi:hypothetical protein [Altererythrobacter sp. BO-6]|nr:hypothetical protein [Altererythrobacter sp. BO-6]
MTNALAHFNERICMTRWQAYLLLGSSGFAVGTLLARTVDAIGL